MYANIDEHVRYRGDATALNLCSLEAPQKIFADFPNARFIVSFRDPTDFIIFFFKDNLRWRHERQLDFAMAVCQDRDIEHDKTIPEECWHPKCLRYYAIAQFSQQLNRYFEYFDRSQFFLLTLDDLKNEPLKLLNELVGFLELEDFRFDNCGKT